MITLMFSGLKKTCEQDGFEAVACICKGSVSDSKLSFCSEREYEMLPFLGPSSSLKYWGRCSGLDAL